MAPEGGPAAGRWELLRAADLTSRERYQLLTSLVVPRPIGWVSTRDDVGAPNLAPFSFYTALSTSPMMVGMSVGRRASEPKDTLVNARRTGAFCVNVVDEAQLYAMNLTGGDFAPEVDEARRAGLTLAEADSVPAPYVSDAPAVLECDLHRTLELDPAPNTLMVGRVRAIRLSRELETVPGTRFVDAESLLPVGRLHGRAYGLLGEVRFVSRGDEDEERERP